jgi:AsmA protein
VKALRYAAIGLAALVALVAIAIGVVIAKVDPNDYKPQIIELVKERTGRTLTLGGPIRLTFFPSVGAAVDKVALSGPGGQGSFASVSNARVAVKLLPLLSRQVVVDEIRLTGLHAELVRFRDGRTNFSDLTGEASADAAKAPQKPADNPPASSPAGSIAGIEVGGIALKDANLVWRDEADGTDLRIDNLDLRTDRIASGVPGRLAISANVTGVQPKIALTLSASSGYLADLDKRSLSLTGLDVKVSGNTPGAAGLDAQVKGDVAIDTAADRIRVADFTLRATSKDGLAANLAVPSLELAPDRAVSKAIEGSLRIDRPEQKVDAKLALDSATLQGKAVEFPRVAIELDARQAGLGVRGTLGGPVRVDLARHTVTLPNLEGRFDVTGASLPPAGVKLAVDGSADADWVRQTAATQLAAKLDQSTIQARVKVSRFAPLAASFDVQADRLDVDRYLPPKPKAAAAGAPSATAPAAAASPGSAAAAETPIDLSALKGLDLNGTAKVGALKVAHVELASVAMTMKAAGGRLDVNPLSANLYQGALAGAAAVNANDNGYALKAQLTNIAVGPLLRDVAEKDVLEGRGNVNLDVRATGTTPAALKKALAGGASVALRDGAIKGVNLAEVLRRAKAALGSRSAADEIARGGDRTDFSEMTATFVIRDGVARNDDFAAKSPFLRIAGEGSIDIPAGSLDYLVKATVVDTSGGQGGKDLDQLRGITVPVRLAGPFDRIGYKVDVAALAAEVAKAEASRVLGGKSGGSIGDALRGLFGGKK